MYNTLQALTSVSAIHSEGQTVDGFHPRTHPIVQGVNGKYLQFSRSLTAWNPGTQILLLKLAPEFHKKPLVFSGAIFTVLGDMEKRLNGRCCCGAAALRQLDLTQRGGGHLDRNITRVHRPDL